MAEWNWNGSRWWKFDFHSHTSASEDYGQGTQQAQLKSRTPEEWLLDYMRAEIDCVAVTDHNSGAWVDLLRTAYTEMDSNRPVGFRRIHLFPGVEISVQGSVHLLAILGVDSTTSDIDSLLGAVGFDGTKGSSDGVTRRSFSDVVSDIERAGGIAIPAHVDRSCGLFCLPGNTLKQALASEGVFAMEVSDPASGRPSTYKEMRLEWAEVLGSDSHHPSGPPGARYPGSHYTWVKMGSPSLEGLRLALLDGALSILRSDETTAYPNEHAPLALESVEIKGARYMGREEPLKLPFSPWLNTVIGGRGTGKSSLVEFLRLALRREDELNELSSELKPEFEKYAMVSGSSDDIGLLTADAEIRVVYRKDGLRFRIQWSPDGSLDAIEEDFDGGWRLAEGDIPKRFPIRAYSQKQIFHLAKAPLALLRVVDEGVDHGSWDARWKESEGRFLSLRAKAREIEDGLAQESSLKGELDDVKRKLAIFEGAGHADVLKSFQKRRRQQRSVEDWEEGWAVAGDRLREMAEELTPELPDEATLDLEDTDDAALHESIAAARDRLGAVCESLGNLATQADEILSGWRSARDASAWRQAVDAATEAYGALRERLEAEGAGDPAAYGELVQRRQSIEQNLIQLESRKQEARSLREQAESCLKGLLELRRERTKDRRSFLQGVLEDNQHVRIWAVPYGARETVEIEFRQLIQREAGGFEKDIGSPYGGGLLEDLYKNDSRLEDIEDALAAIKRRIRQIYEGAYDPESLEDQRFATHVRKLQPETLDRLDLWFPEDSLDVRYSTTGDGRAFRPIREGSPGQKTAALLAFLLSYGKEPLILDQPEDDLDNSLIYDLIVTQLREVKRRRQVIVVTHNANIVVNGDAELVVALDVTDGETQKQCEGSLQEKQVRDAICKIMEGGRVAFEQRYRRIALGGQHVR